MARVDRLRTPLTAHELLGVLALGHEGAFGATPTMQRLGVSWAHVSHETGRGRSVWCHNLANLTCRRTEPGDWFDLTTTEYMQGDGKGAKTMTLAYRAYPGAQAGAVAYWKMLAGRYAPALALFDDGDAALVAAKLGDLKYFTGPRAAYAASMASLYREFVRLFANPPPPEAA